MPPRKGQRQARGLARQEQILEAAFERFATSGYRSTTLAVIAEQVGITEAGVLHHFPSKEALLLAVLKGRDNPDPDLEAWVAEPGGGIESIRRSAVMARALVENPLLARFDAVMGGEALAEGGPVLEHFRHRIHAIREVVAAALQEGIDRGEIREGVDVRATADAFVAFMNGIQNLWLLEPGSVDLEGAYQQFVETMVRAIQT